MEGGMSQSLEVTTAGRGHTHYWDIVFYHQRRFLSTLFKNTHGFSMCGPEKANSVHTEQPIARSDCALSEGGTKEQSLLILRNGA